MRRSRRAGWTALALLLTALSGACGRPRDRLGAQAAAALTGGDAQRGARAIRRYGCDACHTIPGVPGADGQVGPPLGGLAERMYIAGVLANSPANLVHWIRDPRGVDPATAMPDVGVSERDARDIAAYLYALP